MRSDGFENALTGLGYLSRDKRRSTKHATEVVDDEQAIDLWRGNDIAARAIETWPAEMLRTGWRLQFEDLDLQSDIKAAADDLGLDAAIEEWLQYERAYGGAAMLLGVNDGSTDLRQPLNYDRVRAFEWVTVLEPREIRPMLWQSNPRDKGFGRPVIWEITPDNPGEPLNPKMRHQSLVQVHASRLIIAPGIRVSRRHVSNRLGFGDSVLTRIWSVLRDFGVTWESVAVLLNDFAQAVYKIQGLAEAFATDQDDLIKRRFEALELGRSVLRGMVLDAEEDFSRNTTPLTGVPEILDRFESRLAAAAEMPITVLMGRSPGGLNATGDSDMRIFYDRVDAKRKKRLKPILEQLVRLLMRARQIQEPESWEVAFNPLWEPTGKERAEERKLVAETDAIYISAGVVAPDEVARSRWSGPEWSPDMSIDFDDRSEYDAMKEAEAQEAAAAAELSALKQTPPSGNTKDE